MKNNNDDFTDNFDDELNDDDDSLSYDEICKTVMPTYEAPAKYKGKRNDKGELVINKKLTFDECFKWNQQDEYPGSKDFVDTREYFRDVTCEPKTDFDKYYATNMMYFKNVGVHEMYDYIKANNFFIDHTEKHDFAYHMGRSTWRTVMLGIIAFGIVLFLIEMFVMGIG